MTQMKSLLTVLLEKHLKWQEIFTIGTGEALQYAMYTRLRCARISTTKKTGSGGIF